MISITFLPRAAGAAPRDHVRAGGHALRGDRAAVPQRGPGLQRRRARGPDGGLLAPRRRCSRRDGGAGEEEPRERLEYIMVRYI